MDDHVAEFHRLHSSGCFVMPNPWDLGTARALEQMGFKALATTSAGLAWTLGTPDGQVTLDEALEHLRQISGAVTVPVNADFENGYAVEPAQVAENVKKRSRRACRSRHRPPRRRLRFAQRARCALRRGRWEWQLPRTDWPRCDRRPGGSRWSRRPPRWRRGTRPPSLRRGRRTPAPRPPRRARGQPWRRRSSSGDRASLGPTTATYRCALRASPAARRPACEQAGRARRPSRRRGRRQPRTLVAAARLDRERDVGRRQEGAGCHQERARHSQPNPYVAVGPVASGDRRRVVQPGSARRRARTARPAVETTGEAGGFISPIPPASCRTIRSAQTTSTMSTSSNTVNAVSPSYQSRNRLTSSSTAPMAAISGPKGMVV